MLRLVQPAFPCPLIETFRGRLCLKPCVCYLGADLKPHIYFSTSPAALFSSSTLLFSASAAFLALSCAVVRVLTYLSTICPADSVLHYPLLFFLTSGLQQAPPCLLPYCKHLQLSLPSFPQPDVLLWSFF